MALSVLYVRFRDVAIIWVVVAQVLLYLTPILYPINAFEEENRIEHLLMFNPLAVIFNQIRVWVLARTGRPAGPSRRRLARPASRDDHLPRRDRLRCLDLQTRSPPGRRGALIASG